MATSGDQKGIRVKLVKQNSIDWCCRFVKFKKLVYATMWQKAHYPKDPQECYALFFFHFVLL